MDQGHGGFSSGNSYATNYGVGGGPFNTQHNTLDGGGFPPPPPSYNAAISGQYNNVSYTPQHGMFTNGATVAPYRAPGQTVGNVTYVNGVGGQPAVIGQPARRTTCTPCVLISVIVGFACCIFVLPAVIVVAVILSTEDDYSDY
ncbi:uncharacterized protein LOC128229977 isoform X2 [Mya arenaria]|uniref:uncharacterized protein LOC128229977 isoform X1 n=1 Tax=Mya arenaria TaxID=6604 RepID=UPI0022E8D33E|nr:uncharacterized protein LOC128229977 isoform X1 [Mya arenaria]XP_052797881.1 uncharacterized protein LOC128229977 isoform X2 [Mya arenaria]